MNKTDPVELTKRFIEIPSVAREETEIPEYIASLVNGEVQEFHCHGKRCGSNVIAISDPHPGEPFLLLNGHHDTVAPAEGWSTDPFRAVVRDDRLYGLGAKDMKSGLAIMTNIFLEFRDRLNLIFTAVGDEEIDSTGSFSLLNGENAPLRPYFDRKRIMGALIAEPTDEKVMLGARGRYALQISVHGKAAHGARPRLGESAIEKAADIITALRGMEMDTHPVLGAGSYCVLKISGGSETLSVPDRCTLVVDRHITRKMAAEEVIKGFKEALSNFNGVDVRTVEREVPFLMPYVRSAEEPFIREFLNSGDEIIYGESVGDFNIFGGIMPTVVYGPAGEAHHSPDEFVSISSIERVHTRLRGFLEALVHDRPAEAQDD